MRCVAVVLDTLPDPLYDDVNTLKKVHSQSHFEIQLLLTHLTHDKILYK